MLEDRRDQQPERCQHQQARRSSARHGVERLARRLEPPGEHRCPQAEQEVADDRAGDRRLDDVDQPLLEGEQADDDLGGVAERGVQQAPAVGPSVLGQRLGGVPHQARQRRDRQRRRREDQDRIRPPPVSAIAIGMNTRRTVQLPRHLRLRSNP